MVAGCCGGKLVDGDRLVLVDVGVEEVPGEIGDIDAEIGEGAYDCTIGDWNCAGKA